ncbi:MAG: class I SAM-dependent methyltransferase, partial [Candidatus Shapirobacteria bacterium]|nr:class I SAM-dependent methyltransferase [Candidatus Shapirobacteria bacterium]
MNRNKWNNTGWSDNEPTEEIVNSFKKGIIKTGDRLLDIGCGFGRNSNWLASKGVIVTAININKNEIDEAMTRAVKLGVYVNYFLAEATNLPLEKNDFDV